MLRTGITRTGVATLGLGLLLSACGGGGEEETASWWLSFEEGTDPPASSADGARFLEQSTFGPTLEELEGLDYAGFDQWFSYQAGLAPTLHHPLVAARSAQGLPTYQHHRHEHWYRRAVTAPDQLRQRVAFALSQILVVSDDSGELQNQQEFVAEYTDVLVRGALGNYRDLLKDVTKSPTMGLYLSHLQNAKGDPANNIRPDENYARELMQLFTIGLVELNLDGTQVTDLGGDPVPTYTQLDIENLARALTGWNYAGATSWNFPQRNIDPMEPWEEYHDTDAKTIVGGVFLPAGQTAEQDLDAALDAVFEHPSHAPFLATRLIQRLVTSNPSPAYVERVAQVYEDNGSGERGDLLATVRAILMDDEARNGHLAAPTTYGKLREPVVRMVGLWRAFDAKAANGEYDVGPHDTNFGQAPLSAPSVFNFYFPDFSPSGPLADAGLVGPEHQIATHSLVTSATNRYWQEIYRAYPGYTSDSDHVLLNLTDELALAEDPAALVDHLDLLLMAGQMSSAMRSTLVTHVSNVDLDEGNKGDGMQRVLDAIYLIVSSPEGSIQR